MKTAVHIPDELYQEAKSQADAVGVTVDEFAIEAIRARIENRKISTDEVTEILNTIFVKLPSSLDPILAEMQWRSLEKEEW